jgi:predicted aspartyl protease
MAISRPSLLIKGKLFDREIDFILDTGAQNCVIDYKLVKSLGFEEYIDKRQKTLVVGIGQNLSHGIIPYAELEIEGSLYPIMFTVIDMPHGASTHPLIGLNFMMFYWVIIIRLLSIPSITERSCYSVFLLYF